MIDCVIWLGLTLEHFSQLLLKLGHRPQLEELLVIGVVDIQQRVD